MSGAIDTMECDMMECENCYHIHSKLSIHVATYSTTLTLLTGKESLHGSNNLRVCRGMSGVPE